MSNANARQKLCSSLRQRRRRAQAWKNRLTTSANLETLEPRRLLAGLFAESFEAAGPNYDSGLVTFGANSNPQTVGVDMIYNRTDGSDHSNQTGAYTGFDGSYYWAAEGTEWLTGGMAASEKTMNITGINISSHNNLTVSGLFAADGEFGISSDNFDSQTDNLLDDHVEVYYRIDGGAFTPAIFLQAENPVGNNNEVFRRDTDFDGIGDGVQITNTFQQFTFAIPSTGNTLDLQIVTNMDNTQEEAAYDNLLVEGDLVAVNTPPTVSGVTASDVGEPEIGDPSYSFTVQYSDNSAVDASTIGTADVTVTGPGGPVTITGGTTVDPTGTPLTATYTFTPPGGSWDASDNGSYNISLNANEVGDDGAPQLFAPAGVIGSFNVNATNTAPVVDNVVANDVIFFDLGDTFYSFTIDFSDIGGVDASTIDLNDVTVTGPGGPLTVTGGTTADPDGTNVTGTYTVTPPGGDWDASDDGTYTIAILANEVCDVAPSPDTLCVAANPTLATFDVISNKLLNESFETDGDGGVRYTAAPATFDTANGIFDRTDGSTIAHSGTPFSGKDGDFFWGAEFFFDSPSGNVVHKIDFNQVDISNHTNLQFMGLFAADGQGVRFDPPDFMRVTYSINGNPYQNGVWFSQVQNGSNNEPIASDPNFDGDGVDGTLLTSAFSSFAFNIPDGNTLDLRIEVASDGPDEELAFDNFMVTGDLIVGNTPPLVTTVAAANVGEPEIGDTSYSFTVQYSDNSAVDASTIDASDVTVTGPGGAVTIVSGMTSDPTGSPLTATYTFTPPGGDWDAADNGLYTIDLNGSEVGDDGAPQLFAAAGTIGSFNVNATNTAPVVDNVLAEDVIFFNLGETSYSFTIDFTDVGGVDASTIDLSDVTVTGPGGSLTVTGGTTADPDGTNVTGTYTVTPPGGDWDAGDAGTYTIAILANEVCDIAPSPHTLCVAANPTLATFELLPDKLLNESFETDGLGSRYAADTSFNNGNSGATAAYFDRISSAVGNSSGAYTGQDGSFFWAADFTAAGGAAGTTETLTFTDIDISNHDTLVFGGLFAADGDASGLRFDPDDFLTVSYRIDGAGADPFTQGIGFETITADGNNEPIYVDANNDGDGDGVPVGGLGKAFSMFDFNIPGTGNTLDLLIEVDMDDNDNEFAFDDLMVSGNLVVPDVNLSLSTNSGTEAAETVVTVTATADFPVNGDQTVDLSVSGTGITGTDYVLSDTTITIQDGMTTGSVTFTIEDDNLVEETMETATLSISNPSGGVTLGPTTSDTVDITDNDTATFTINDVAASENAGTLDFTLSLSNPVDIAVDVDVSFADITTDGADFDHTTQTISFPMGLNASQTVSVPLNDDGTPEPPETFIAGLAINAGTPTGTRSVDTSDTGTGTILDDDADTTSIFDDNAATAEGTQMVSMMVMVEPGVNKVLVINVAYTDSSGITVMVDDPNDDDPAETLLVPAVQESVNPSSMPNTLLTNAIYVLPIDDDDPLYDTMDRKFNIKITGGKSTDILASAGTYSAISQLSPVFATDSISEDAGTDDTVINLATNPPKDTTIDSVLILERNDGNAETISVPAEQELHTQQQFQITNTQNVLQYATSADESADSNPEDMQYDFSPISETAIHVGLTLLNCGNGLDGCALLPDLEWGDAPETDQNDGLPFGYPTTDANSGASHAPKGPKLGTARDTEPDGQPAVFASGDDLDLDGDDEDGVFFPAAIIAQTMPGQTAEVDVEVSMLDPGETAYLNAWIDFNRDGDWDDTGEQIFAGHAINSNGTHTLSFPVPTSLDDGDVAVESGTSFARFRLHTGMLESTVLSPRGPANNGEVEDHPVALLVGTEVHGQKFEDMDADGVKEPGDTPLPGVTIRLRRDGDPNTPVVDLFGDEVPDMVTNANGEYWFKNLLAGTYVVSEIAWDTNDDGVSDVDQGIAPSTSTDLTVGPLDQGENSEDNDFGNFVFGSIHGFKYLDKNANGMHDDGEEPMEGVVFKLFRRLPDTIEVSTGKILEHWSDPIDRTMTDMHGDFWFTDLLPGEQYEVREMVPAGFEPSRDPANFRTPGLLLSRQEYVYRDGATVMPQPKLTPPVDVLNQDDVDRAEELAALKEEINVGNALQFGNVQLGTVTGQKWIDRDLDGFGDGDGDGIGDAPLEGVKFRLVGTDGMGNAVDRTVETGPNGFFTFFSVKPGDYTVAELPADQQDINDDGIPDDQQGLVVLDTTPRAINIMSGETEDFTGEDGWLNYITGSIHGFKFHDLNANGQFDGDDQPEEGIRFTLHRRMSDTIEVSTGKTIINWSDPLHTEVTDIHGEFWFTDLLPGEQYQVREVLEGERQASTLTVFEISRTPDATVHGELLSGEEYVWAPGASAMPSPDLAPPVDVLNQDDVDRANALVDLKTEIVSGDLSFGNYFNGDIVGTKYEDINNNGQRDPGEPPLPNIRIGLKGNAVDKTTTTGPNGFFAFLDLKPGNYTVRELNANSQDINSDGITDDQQGLVHDPRQPMVELTSGETENVGEFRNFFTGSIHGFKYHDLNANGVQDGEETGLKNIKFTLHERLPDTIEESTGRVIINWSEPIDRTITDVHGDFWFEGIIPGMQYQVREVLEDGRQASTPTTFTTDGILLSRQEYVYKDGAHIMATKETAPPTDVLNQDDLDRAAQLQVFKHPVNVGDELVFGNFLFGEITGTKLEDLDNDGTGDQGMANVTFILEGTDGMGNAVSRTTTTNGMGKFVFDKVKPGVYTTRELPADEQDTDNNGISDDLQGLVVLDTAPRGETIVSGEVVDEGIWLNYITGSIHGFKYHDLDANGSFDNDDVPLEGIDFQLYRRLEDTFETSTGKVIENWELMRTETTDVHGDFWFTDLTPGEQYEVREVLGGRLASTPTKFRTNGVLRSAEEYVFEPDAHIMVTPDLVEPLDKITQADKDRAAALQNLKRPNDVGARLQFGNYTNGMISGFKYEDFNRNFQFDDGLDQPLANVIFRLSGKDGMGNVVDRTAVTDADGIFKFNDVKPSDMDYMVTELLASGQDINGDGISDNLQGLVVPDPNFRKVDLTSGKNANTGAWGNHVTGSIHGFKYHDLDANGTFDNDDEPLVGIKFQLYRRLEDSFETSTGKVIENWQFQRSETTDVHGDFWFTELPPGEQYEVREVLEGDRKGSTPTTFRTDGILLSRQEYVYADDAYIMVTPDLVAPLDQITQADIDRATDLQALKDPVNVGMDLEFGNYQEGSIGGIKLEDHDNDGQATRPIVGIKFRLTGTDGMGQSIDKTIKTGVDGRFNFTGLKPGHYEVAELPAHEQDLNNDGISDDLQGLVVLDTAPRAETLTSGESVDKGQWLNYFSGSIHGNKFDDLNADGIRNAEDPGLPGVKFQIYKRLEDGFQQSTGEVFERFELLSTETTDIHGDFWFTGLEPGYQYEVREVLEGGRKASTPTTFRTSGILHSRQEYVFETDAHIMVTPDLAEPLDKITQADKDHARQLQIFKDPIDVGNNLVFGNYLNGDIFGTKYEDINNNDTRDAGEPGLPNVRMRLTGIDGMGDAVNMTTTTGPNGFFQFPDLKPGEYHVAELPASQQDINQDDIADNLQGLIVDPNVRDRTLTSGETENAGEFGNYVLGSIHGHKFHDLDADGIRDDDEPGRQAVLFELEKLTGIELEPSTGEEIEIFETIDTTRTDIHGDFWFTDLMPGMEYRVREVLDGGFKASTPVIFRTSGVLLSRQEYVFEDGASIMPTADLAEPFDILTPADRDRAVALAALKVEVNVGAELEFGNYRDGMIFGEKYHDLNNDGDRDANEPGLASVLFHLDGVDGMGNPVNKTGLTDDSGRIEFSGLKPGDYTIREAAAADQDINNDGVADDLQGLIVVDTANRNVELESDKTEDAGDWRNFILGSIHGYKYEDVDGSGDFDSSIDKDFPGVAFDLYKLIGVELEPSGKEILQWQFLRRELTDVHGDFWFTDLMPGMVYEVRENLDATDTNNNGIPDSAEGLIATTPTKFRTDGVLLSGQEYVSRPDGHIMTTDPTLAPPEDVLTPDDIQRSRELEALKTPTDVGSDLMFGNFIEGSIHGFKFHDIDADGHRDFDEDDNNNGILDTFPIAHSEDADGDGHLDVFEPGLPGAVFRLDKWDGTEWKPHSEETTDDDGQFWFTGLENGRYRVVEELNLVDTNADWIPDVDQGMVATTPTEFVISELESRQEYVWAEGAAMLPDGALQRETGVIPALSFGDSFQGSIHGLKFEDIDGDGQRDANEPVLPGVAFVLQSLNGDTWNTVGGTETSDDNGQFWFENLQPGLRYRVVELLRASNTNADGTSDLFQGLRPSNSEIVARLDAERFVVYDTIDILTSGEEFVHADGTAHLDGPLDAFQHETVVGDELEIGNHITGSIHGFKFEDIDGDGVWDHGSDKRPDEPPLRNVMIQLFDEDRNVVDETTTDINGEFWFENLHPGTYTFGEDLSRSDSNMDGVPDDQQGMVRSTDPDMEVTVHGREELVWRPGAAMLDPVLDALRHETFPEDSTPNNGVYDPLLIGNYITGSIHGFKFMDKNADGFYDPTLMGKDEPFEWGVFELVNAVSGESVAIEHTNDDGEFWFVDIAPGTYIVRERTDLTDRNDLDGDGLPDDRDTDGDGIPDAFGDGIPDDQQGLRISTHDQVELTIRSREEFVYETGAAMLTGPGTPLKHEVSMPVLPNGQNELMFGDYYTGSIHGIKVHSDSGLPAPNIPLELIDLAGKVVASTTTNDVGEYWFENVDPGTYAVDEVLTPAVIRPARAFPVIVGVAEVIAYEAGAGHPIVGLQTEIVNPVLTLRNEIRGSIHGVKVHQGTGRPIPGITIQLTDMSGELLGQTVTDIGGEFWFDDLNPDLYVVEEIAPPTTLVAAEAVALTVGSGEEHVAFAGQAMLDPGQFEVVDAKLTLVNSIEASVHGIVVDDNGNPVAGARVTLSGGGTFRPTLSESNGHYWFEDLEPGDYTVTGGSESVPVHLSSGEEESAIAGQAMLEVGQYETVNANLVLGGAIPADSEGPVVTEVRFSGSTWTAPFKALVDPVDGVGVALADGPGQATPLHYGNVNQIHVDFSEPVQGSGPGGTLIAADFALVGVNKLAYEISNVSYDAGANRATLSTSRSLPTDRYRVAVNDITVSDLAGNPLDGEWTDNVTVGDSGDDVAGGVFQYSFNVLVGDFTQDSVVNIFDLNTLAMAFATQIGDAQYSVFADSTGAGVVNIFDVNNLALNWLTTLPSGTPGNPMPAVAAAVDSAFEDLGETQDDDELLEDLLSDLTDTDVFEA